MAHFLVHSCNPQTTLHHVFLLLKMVLRYSIQEEAEYATFPLSYTIDILYGRQWSVDQANKHLLSQVHELVADGVRAVAFTSFLQRSPMNHVITPRAGLSEIVSPGRSRAHPLRHERQDG